MSDRTPHPSRPVDDDISLTATGLCLQIGSRVLVRDINLTIRRGEFWCIVGANGTGKTTLLDTLAGLRPPQSGAIELTGRPRHDLRPAQAAYLCGYLPQGGDALEGMTALQAALLGRHPHRAGRLWESNEDIAIAIAALAQVDMAGMAERDVSTLSGGERQRVAAAALLAQDPLIYLLDEPLNHLDLRHQIALMDLLAAQARVHRRAVVITIHDLSLAARYASHVVLMPAQGTAAALAQIGPAATVLQPEAIGTAFGHPVRRLTLDGITVFVPV